MADTTTTTTTPTTETAAATATATATTETATSDPCAKPADVSGLLPTAAAKTPGTNATSGASACAVSIRIHVEAPAGACVAVHGGGDASPEPCADATVEPEQTATKPGCLAFITEIAGESVVGDAAVFFTEALAKLNAREFRELEAKGQTLPSYPCGVDWTIDPAAPLRDALCLSEHGVGHPASVVAYAVGLLLARGQACRVVLIDGERLAYQLADGEVVDPLSKYLNAKPDQEQTSGQQHGDG